MVFEVCERRLVLSAQLMFDVLADQALELHGDVHITPHADSIPVETHLQEAHAASGWNDVQQRFGLTGKGQTVAVIDSGIAWDHVALGKGFGSGYRVVGGWDFTEENDANPYDDGPMGFHGTHVAGIIGSDDPRHPGVAPGADLVALRVFNDMGQGQLSWVEQALQWVHNNRNSFENPITTVNLSLGTVWNANVVPEWGTLEDELQTLFNDGIVVTASAGNSFQRYSTPGLSYPAVSPHVLPVASVDDNGSLSDFSQRNEHVIAAPGRNIVSTVPDHVLGRDGKIDDFTAASGTSMSAPYVAGASVLVRQAMEMTGYAGINLTTIADHLHATADAVYDALTSHTYDRLNLERAIDTLIPGDSVGDNFHTAGHYDLSGGHGIDGWINTLGDTDVYRFTPASGGSLRIDADSRWLDSLHWSLQTSGGQTLAGGGLDPRTVALAAGQTYQLIISADHEIGTYHFGMDYTPQAIGGGSGGESSAPPRSDVSNLGSVHYLESTINAGQSLRVQASQSGIFSVQWTNHDAQVGSLTVTRDGGSALRDTTWENGALRIDVNVNAGQWLEIQLPGGTGSQALADQGDLALANVLARSGGTLNLRGTLDNDLIGVDVSDGIKLNFGKVHYAYPAGTIGQLTIDAHGGNDQLSVVGSAESEKVELRSGGSTIQNSQIQIVATAVEQVAFAGGGGPDRVYVYGSDGDDTLIARPRSAELSGVGYRFAVQQVDRIYVHATGSGQDVAYLYDSAGNDRLSVRPQFSSVTGPNFFNYVGGFERVYAYANAGGHDVAELYGSSGNDRFNTSGATASIVGPGYASFTHAFEQVNAHAGLGGKDLASLYGANAQTQWQQGSDFIRFIEQGLVREARGFQAVETYIAGQSHVLSATANHIELMPQREQVVESTELLPQFEYFQSPLARQVLPEMQILRELRHASDWLSERLQLPNETLLVDPEQEFAMLDEIFGVGS